MNIDALIPGVGAILCGLLLTLLAYNIIGRKFTHEDFHSWLNNRRTMYKILGPLLILGGAAILLWR